MKRALISGLMVLASIPAFSESALLRSLPEQCYFAANKMHEAMKDETDKTCKNFLSGNQFHFTGDALHKGDVSSARVHIISELDDIKYAKAMECEQHELIAWARITAEEIKDKLSKL